MKYPPVYGRAFLYLGFFMLCGALFAEVPPFTQGKTRGGSVSDGLDVGNIRRGRHVSFDRLVFDVAWWEGAGGDARLPAASSGHFQVEPVKVGQEYAIELGGFRAFSASLPVFSGTGRVMYLTRRKGEAYEDDSTIALLIGIRPGLCYRAFALTDPARIVIDVGECR